MYTKLSLSAGIFSGLLSFDRCHTSFDAFFVNSSQKLIAPFEVVIAYVTTNARHYNMRPWLCINPFDHLIS